MLPNVTAFSRPSLRQSSFSSEDLSVESRTTPPNSPEKFFNDIYEFRSLEKIDPIVIEDFIQGKIPADENDLSKIVTYALKHEPRVFQWIMQPEHNITCLCLNFGGLGNQEITRLAMALKTNTSLRTFDLSWSNIDGTSIKHLAEALRINTFLTKLTLLSNKISNVDIEYLADALKVLPSLTTIDLGWNKFGDTGTSNLAEALKFLPSLTTINLDWNEIGDTGTKDLVFPF